MRNHLKHFLLMAVMVLISTASFAQIKVTGQLVDAETSEPLIGAAVVQDGTTNGVVTDFDGYFTLSVKKNSIVLFKYVGYKDLKLKAPANGKMGVVKMKGDAIILKDVVVTSTMAVARKTPVAVSSVTNLQIEEKLGTLEFPEILKSTPGVHANKQGGGFGDSEIYMRGFDNTNVAVMINGVPMNDMENGNVYWSNWAGLSDVTRSMQTQRGLGASKVSSPSVGGTINIITNSLEAKRGGNVSYAMGNDGMNKILFTVSSGMTKSGWAFSVLGAKNWGSRPAQGTDYEGYNYFVNISKKLGDKHQLSFTAFGAPQEHYKRSGSLTIAGWKEVEAKYGVKDYKYNADYGFDNNGQRRTADYNIYHKPQISLNHQWMINDKSSLSTAIYTSIGRGGGYAGQANEDYKDELGINRNDWRGSSYGNLTTKFRKADGTFDYGAIQDINEASENGSMYIMSESKNHHNWYGLLSTYTNQLSEAFNFYGGIDFRYYEGTHTNEIIDLYGGDYYMDNNRHNAKLAYNKNANDAWVYEKLGIGDAVYRDYNSYITQGGAFFQLEYSKDKLSAFVSGSASNTYYWRKEHMYYDKEHERSETKNYWGFTAKAGANFNFNEYHNVFFNAGTISRAPKFAYGVFMNPQNGNVTNPNAKNEKIYSVEFGYGYHNSWFAANLNGYYTMWKDKTMTKFGTMGQEQTEYFMNMTGVDAKHMGIELDMKAKITPWLNLTGMFSYGDWKWDSNAVGYAYDAVGNPLNKQGGIASEAGGEDHVSSIINLKGLRVGGSAQTTAAVGANVKLSKYLRMGADWSYQSRNYSYYSFSGSNLSLGKETNIMSPWKIPASSTLDINASYGFKIGGLNARLSGNVNNLLNYQYIIKAWNPSTVASGSNTAATADNIYCFFDQGRTYSVRLKVNF